MRERTEVYGRIYVATSRTSGKSYVGQTTGAIQGRWKRHAHGNSVVLVKAVRKYGLDDFDVREVDTARNRDELNEKECAWIDRVGSMVPSGYNLREGGGGRGRFSEESRRKMSESHKGKRPSAETRQKMREAQRRRRELEASTDGGPVFTESSRAAMRNAKLGTRHSEATRLKMSIGRTGRRPTMETREKLSRAARRRAR